MKIRIGSMILPTLAVILLVFSIIQVVLAQQKPPQPQPPIEPAQTIFGKTVAGSGIVEARTENISIGAALPGMVLEIYVPVEAVGQSVKKGQMLCKVDDRQLQAQLKLQMVNLDGAQAQLKLQQANLEAARAQLAKLRAQPRKEEVPPLEAALDAAEFSFKVQEDTAKRNNELYPQNAIPGKDWLQSQYLAKLAHHQRLQAKANLELLKAGAWKYDLDIAQANVEVAEAQVALAKKANIEVAEAQVNQTRTDIERSIIRATIDGEVLQVNIRPGEYVGAPPSQAVYVLGSIKPLNIRVDIDEHDIPRAYPWFKKGVKVVCNPRGDTSQKIPLVFDRVEPYVIPKKSLTGDNTERVDTRVLQVIYRVDRDDPALYVGMQVDVFLDAE